MMEIMRASIFALFAVCVSLSPVRAGSDNGEVRDAVSRPMPGRYGTVPGAIRGGSNWLQFDQFQYIPPATPKGVHNAFWSTVYGLERKHVAFGYQHGRQQLVNQIRTDLARMERNERHEAMLSFLRVTHHYRGKKSKDVLPEIRRFHQRRFEDEVRGFVKKAKREYIEKQNRVYLDFFSHIRALADSGPEGLRLSQELAAMNSDNAAVLANLAQDLVDAGQLESAVDASERSIKLNPGNPKPYTALASAKYSLKEYEAAYAAANEALRIDPGDKIAYSIVKLIKGHVSLPMVDGAEQFPGGIMTAEEAPAEAFAPAAPTAMNASGLRPAATLGAARETAKHLAAQAKLELRKGDYAKAALLTTQAIEKDPRNTAALFRRALANVRRERLTEALSDTEAALELMGDSPSPILLSLHAQVLN
ncbi:tetratricopeptide repeat protein, partial [Elusimicrobiota bacterium]